MTNTTDVYWEARGVSLHTPAWSLETFEGRLRPPETRGEDLIIPFHTGRVRTPKFRDSNTYPLKMWLAPLNIDGTRDLAMPDHKKIQQNWRYLRDLFDVDGGFDLTKRWYANDGSVAAATASAELLEAPEPVSRARDVLGVTFTVTMADPYFYGAPVTENVGTIDVAGDASTEHLTITMGPGRFTGADGNWIEYNGTGTVVLDVAKRSAKKGTAYVNGQITRNLNFQTWPTLKPGTNNLTGTGTVTYSPAYK